jgi:hypothetical protein
VLTTYGRASGFCIDPIEKKPLNHFQSATAQGFLRTYGRGERRSQGVYRGEIITVLETITFMS